MGVWDRIKSKKKKGGAAKASKAPVAHDSDSDLSLMTDSDLEEERAALRAALDKQSSSRELAGARGADPFEQASLWAEVDRDELERIAINIARNALPQSAGSEGAEAAVRLNASAAAAEQAELHDSTDPLGYGRIDTRTLTLVRDSGPAGRQPPRYSAASTALLDAARRSAMAGRGRGAGADSQQAEAPPALRAKVLPGSEGFDAELYLGTIHADTSLPDLQRGLLALRQQLSEHTGQLKALVKENFDRFISSKNTIDTVYAKLLKAEAEGEAGVHGASTREVLEAVQQVQGEAKRAFGPLLERAAKAERIRLVLGVMRRYEAIVQLPSRVRQHAEAGDYEQVVADYRKAKALLGDQAGTPRAGAVAGGREQQQQQGSSSGGASMWAKLMDEINKVVTSVAHTLETVVRSAASSPAEAADAVRHILQLAAVGVPAAQRMDPVGLYVESQERHVRAMLEGALAQHSAHMESLRRRQQASADGEAEAASLAGLRLSPSASLAGSAATSAAPTPRGGVSAAASGSEALSAAMEAAAVRYVAHITAGLCQWLPDFWALTQQRLPGLAGIGDAAAAVERGMAAAERSVTVLLSLYRSAVQTVLANPAASGLAHTGLLSIASELATGCQALQQASSVAGSSSSSSSAGNSGSGPSAAQQQAAVPAAALDCLQRLTEQAILASLAQLSAHLATAVAALCAAEDFALTPLSRRSTYPATASVAALQGLVQEGMQHLQAALAEGARADADPLRKSAAPARAVFFGCFSAFAKGVDSLAAALTGQGQLAGNSSGGIGAAASGSHHQQSLAAEAAAALARPSRSGSGRDAQQQQQQLSPSRRLLVLCANLSAVRGRLLPQQFGRWGALLRAGGGSKEVQAEAGAVAAELEGVETRLAGAYIDRKQAVLDEVMEVLLFADGTAWEAVPPPSPLQPSVRPAALELVHCLAAVQAELAAVAPALLHEALEELLLGTMDGFAQVLNQGSPPASPGGVLQLWLESAFLLATVAGLAAGSELLPQACGRLQAAADKRLEAAVAAAAAEGGEQAAQLALWLSSGGGSGQPRGQLSAAACRQRLEKLCREAQVAARSNLAPLQQLGGQQR